ncbi:MAG: hypothetical protein AAGD38_23205, partial [Acidobacteriota bacterium]
MSINIANVVTELKKVLAEQRSSREKLGLVQDMVANFLVRALVRDENIGKVAMLRVLQDGVLTFTYPDHLRGGNVLLIDRDSIAGRCLLDGATIIENQMADE